MLKRQRHLLPISAGPAPRNGDAGRCLPPTVAIDNALHRLPWRLHALLFSWWLCDLVDLRLGMTWRELRRDRKTRTPQWRDALRR
jgi:hypothetical protein